MLEGLQSEPDDTKAVTRRRFSRRRVLGTASLLPLAAFVPDLASAQRAAAARPDGAKTHGFFTAHQAAVVDAATRRIAPGPTDDPTEAGHPGAHEAGVVHYIDLMLSMFGHRPAKLFAGGPWSNRHTKGIDHMAAFVHPDRAQSQAWRKRIRQLRRTYRQGIERLDKAAGGDFTKAAALDQDQILASTDIKDFTAVLFQHTIEGMYSVPEYGGNQNLVGWTEIGFPGDSQPRGYTAAEMAAPEPSVVDPTGIVGLLLNDFTLASTIFGSDVWRRA
jgi:hypothetical protein